MRMIDGDALCDWLKDYGRKVIKGERPLSLMYVWKHILDMENIEPEIIHCKDCKHSEHWYRDRARCFLWGECGIGVWNDGFCNYAERREE